MDLIIQGVKDQTNVIITSMQGLERSRLLLRTHLIVLTMPNVVGRTISKIYHVSDSRRIDRVYDEAKHMPFEDFGSISVDKYVDFDESNEPTVPQNEQQRLIICTPEYIFKQTSHGKFIDDSNATLIVFNGITLESLESHCCEAQGQLENLNFLPRSFFSRLVDRCSSIILACNPPIDGLEIELGCKFPVVVSSVPAPCYKKSASIIPRGPSSKPLRFGGLNYNYDDQKLRLHSDTGKYLESLAGALISGGMVVFFPSYGKMVEYHNAWQQAGVFERIGLPYVRENRGGDHFKNGLIKSAKSEKSIFLCTIRYHQDEDLAEFVLAQARIVVFVGLPYPFTNDTWEKRIEHNNQNSSSSMLSGEDLYRYRAIEFMNGIIKRCINEYRFRNLNLFVFDESMECLLDKLAPECGKVSICSTPTEGMILDTKSN